MSTLGSLIDGLGATVHGDAGVSVGEICYDSRRARPGSLFVALRGQVTDGHRYTDDALAAGASALLVEEQPAKSPDVPVAVVPDTRAALPLLAARLYDHPARDLQLIGVTGTNGKTSTVCMIESILRQAKVEAGSIGTISVRYADVEEPTDLTTPESVDLSGRSPPCATPAFAAWRSRCRRTAWRSGAWPRCASPSRCSRS